MVDDFRTETADRARPTTDVASQVLVEPSNILTAVYCRPSAIESR